jgi:hypothetical protein
MGSLHPLGLDFEPPITGDKVDESAERKTRLFVQAYSLLTASSCVTVANDKPLDFGAFPDPLEDLPIRFVSSKEGDMVCVVFLKSPANNPQAAWFKALESRVDTIDDLGGRKIGQIQNIHRAQRTQTRSTLENRTFKNCKSRFFEAKGTRLGMNA